MYQCRLERVTGGESSLSVMVAWIEAKGATVGAQVELLPSKQLWTVAEVFNVMPEDVLKENERLNRSYVKRTDI